MTETKTRRYKITATDEQLDILEALFETMETLGKNGASRTIQLYSDGDGAFRPKFEKFQNGEFHKVETGLLDKDKHEIKLEYGYIKKHCADLRDDTYYIYYDFG